MNGRAAKLKPALAYHVLTPLYDRVVSLTTRESRFKSELIRQAGLQSGQQVLDVGCGTGTLELMALASCKGVSVAGLDADPAILAIARRKAARTGHSPRFELGLSTALPYPDGRFDRVLSSLLFHHLRPDDKAATAREMLRVLRAGGELHVADWGRAAGPISRLAFVAVQLLDGFETTRDAVAGRLPGLLTQAGFSNVSETRRLFTAFGVLSLYRATKR